MQPLLTADDYHLNKRAIAESFGKAAKTYDRHASFQRDVGFRLLNLMPQDLSGKVVVDLGCGTGFFSQHLLNRGAQVLCIDLSSEMLEQAKQKCGEVNISYQQGDAEMLPLLDTSVDYLFSSLALQWCDDLSQPLSEIRRILKPEGIGFFSTLLDGSLYELKQSWAKVDSAQHVNNFITDTQVKAALTHSQCHNYQLNLATIIVWYESAFSVMRDLKGVGANHVNRRSSGLTSRQTLQLVEREYQTFKNQHNLLPASYQVCLGVIHR